MTPIGTCSVCGFELFLNVGDLNIPSHAPSSHIVGVRLCSGSGKPPKYPKKESRSKMRKYAAFYSEGIWMVIFNDSGETEWYTHIPNAGSMDNANQIARLTTEAEANY